MDNIIRKGIIEQVNFSFCYYWGFYFSAGYLFYKKIKAIPFLMSISDNLTCA